MFIWPCPIHKGRANLRKVKTMNSVYLFLAKHAWKVNAFVFAMLVLAAWQIGLAAFNIGLPKWLSILLGLSTLVTGVFQYVVHISDWDDKMSG